MIRRMIIIMKAPLMTREFAFRTASELCFGAFLYLETQ